jgi:hypothetical protein
MKLLKTMPRTMPRTRQEHNKSQTPTAKRPAPELGAAVLPPQGGIQLNIKPPIREREWMLKSSISDVLFVVPLLRFTNLDENTNF